MFSNCWLNPIIPTISCLTQQLFIQVHNQYIMRDVVGMYLDIHPVHVLNSASEHGLRQSFFALLNSIRVPTWNPNIYFIHVVHR